jgi:ubiquinone/menaquinone biosynthesis C-methylase UbiE
VAAIYTAAADAFDSLPFWHHFGRRTVEWLHLSPGARVLDLCCGTGASARPAAEIVGPSGSVLGVDITEALLQQARDKAAARGLAHLRFQCADVAAIDFPAGSFDAVVSVFGLFFLDDMSAVLRRAWTWLAPGGVLAVTTWGEDVLAPGEAWFQEAARQEDPSIAVAGHASRLDTPEKLAAVFEEAGLPPPVIERDRWVMPLASPEDFWPVILGTSNRATLERLSRSAQLRVRASVIERLRTARVRSTAMDTLCARVHLRLMTDD